MIKNEEILFELGYPDNNNKEYNINIYDLLLNKIYIIKSNF